MASNSTPAVFAIKKLFGRFAPRLYFPVTKREGYFIIFIAEPESDNRSIIIYPGLLSLDGLHQMRELLLIVALAIM